MPRALAACLAVSLAGCATFGAQARDGYLRSQLKSYRFQKDCPEVWPTALRVVNDRGFPVVGSDRERIGESQEGFLTTLVSDGFATRTSEGNGLVAETSWNQAVGVRYRIEAKPAEPSGCHIAYILITGGAQGDTRETVGPDWEMLLALVSVVDPASAAEVEAKSPKN